MLSNRLRINYTYYNCPDIFQRIVDWYLGFDPLGELYDYTVIDDGSQRAPLSNVPDHWTVLRIKEDHGWNNEGARNCLMQDTNNAWNLLLDCDWVVNEFNLDKITRTIEAELIDEDTVCMPKNYGGNTMRNSFLVHKHEFWRRGGYDQCFIGYHGVDYSFLRFGEKYDMMGWFEFERIVDDVVPPDEKQRAAEIKKFHAHMDYLEDLDHGYRNREDKQDFVWTNKQAKEFYWKEIDYEKDIK